MLDFKIVYVLNKIIELIKLGHTITILIADIHTILNNTNIAIETETKKFITNLCSSFVRHRIIAVFSSMFPTKNLVKLFSKDSNFVLYETFINIFFFQLTN